MNTRRQFLLETPVALLAIAGACRKGRTAAPVSGTQTPAGAPPTFATAAGSGPPVTAATFAEAEKLAQVTMSPEQRRQGAGSWRQAMAPYLERRTGPRKVALDPADAPALLWSPLLMPGSSSRCNATCWS